MKRLKTLLKVQKLGITIFVAGSIVLFAGHFYLYGQDKSEFPDGYDAMQVAPNSHRVVFENALVRVLEVGNHHVGLVFREEFHGLAPTLCKEQGAPLFRESVLK